MACRRVGLMALRNSNKELKEMTVSFVAKASVLLLFLGSTLFVHLRGKARLPVLRQFVNHSALFAPYNALMYLFSGVPAKPYLDRSKFPNWMCSRTTGR